MLRRHNLDPLRPIRKIKRLYDVGYLSSAVRLVRLWQRRSAGSGDAPRPVAPVRVRGLGGETVWLRDGTSDVTVLFEVFGHGYDRPPECLGGRHVRRVWDLGSNIGLTIAYLAHHFPEARISGVELDAGTAAVARMNIIRWAHRCSILTGAVWTDDGTLRYQLEPGREYGARVADDDPGALRTAKAYALNSLLRNDLWVDYMKMDIEGAERHVLTRNTEWAERVGCIKVEVHPPYAIDECRRDLEGLGFTVTRHHVYAEALVGVRA